MKAHDYAGRAASAVSSAVLGALYSVLGGLMYTLDGWAAVAWFAGGTLAAGALSFGWNLWRYLR